MPATGRKELDKRTLLAEPGSRYRASFEIRVAA
jgi:hypothetical protein